MNTRELFAHLFGAEGCSIITEYIIRKCFNGMNFIDIRNWLEQNGYDRHTTIELKSTEILIMTPDGIMMQMRTADKGKLGAFGGVLNDGEDPRDGAVRELKEETGLDVQLLDLQYVGYNQHEHVYTNGDKALFHTYRYVLRLKEVPFMILNDEANGVEFVTAVVPNIIENQQEFVGDALSGKFEE